MSVADRVWPPRVPILVPGFRRLKSTRAWLSALARHTPGPCELVFLDPNLGDEHIAYLAGVRDMAPFAVRILDGILGRGDFLAADDPESGSPAEHLVLLQPETLVTDGWLDQLIALARLSPEIGMVGPMSNLGPSAQRVENGPGPETRDLAPFASAWRAGHRGQWLKVDSLGPFCVLIKRTVLEACGEWPEILQTIASSPERLVAQIRDMGHELAVARDLYLPRFDNPTALVEEQIFSGLPREVDSRAVDRSSESVASRRRSHRRNRVSLTMIVRDEEDNLPACLEPIAHLFDEMVLVDTGSTDRTVEIAGGLGARVSHFSWIDDFAAARNAALDQATGQFAFWLDADDRIEPSQIETLRQLLDGLDQSAVAYVARCACDPTPGGPSGTTVVDHVRLFPILPDVRWKYRVHEQILPSLGRRGISVQWSDLVIRHTGYADPATRLRKLDRDIRILEAERANRPGDPFVLFNLGAIAVERQEWARALPYLESSLSRSNRGDSITQKLHTLIARCHQGLGDLEAALAACERGLREDSENAELLFRKAVAHRHRGQAEDAAACWRRILTLRRPQRFASVDAGLYGHLPRRNLAALAEEQGNFPEALQLWQAVLGECPGDEPAMHAIHRLKQVHSA